METVTRSLLAPPLVPPRRYTATPALTICICAWRPPSQWPSPRQAHSLPPSLPPTLNAAVRASPRTFLTWPSPRTSRHGNTCTRPVPLQAQVPVQVPMLVLMERCTPRRNVASVPRASSLSILPNRPRMVTTSARIHLPIPTLGRLARQRPLHVGALCRFPVPMTQLSCVRKAVCLRRDRMRFLFPDRMRFLFLVPGRRGWVLGVGRAVGCRWRTGVGRGSSRRASWWAREPAWVSSSCQLSCRPCLVLLLCVWCSMLQQYISNPTPPRISVAPTSIHPIIFIVRASHFSFFVSYKSKRPRTKNPAFPPHPQDQKTNNENFVFFFLLLFVCLVSSLDSKTITKQKKKNTRNEKRRRP